MNELILIAFGLLGLIVGSFLNVAIYRVPIMLQTSWHQECMDFLGKMVKRKKEIFNLWWPLSHCPNCHKSLKFWHNIPVLSFILLQGKCAYCKEPISWQYPLVELASCFIAVFAIYFFGFGIKGVAVVFLSWALIVMFMIDMKHQILPDELTYFMLWVGLVLNAFGTFVPPVEAILGAVIGYCSLWLVAFLFKLIRKIEGMGHGDFKLLAMFGAWLGWKMLLPIILISSVLGTVVGLSLILRHKHEYKAPIAFGPFLIIGAWICLFWGKMILIWYYLKMGIV